MDLTLTGTEIHALREALEIVISDLDKEVAGVADPDVRKALGDRKSALRSIRDKLPAELIDTA
jgi:hypothetical protein